MRLGSSSFYLALCCRIVAPQASHFFSYPSLSHQHGPQHINRFVVRQPWCWCSLRTPSYFRRHSRSEIMQSETCECEFIFVCRRGEKVRNEAAPSPAKRLPTQYCSLTLSAGNCASRCSAIPFRCNSQSITSSPIIHFFRFR